MKVLAILSVIAALCCLAVAADDVTVGHPDHQMRGYMCRKGSSIQISPYTLVYMAGRRRVTNVYAIPSKGRLFGWSGRKFDINITTLGEAMNYINNASLFGDAAKRLNGRRGMFVEQKFLYTAPVTRNESGYPLDFPLARPMDWFNVSLAYVSPDGRQHQIDTDAAIDVVNAAPYVINPDYSIVNKQPRWIPLALADPDQNAVLPLREITAAWISASADASVFPCKIALSKNDPPIDWSKTPTVNLTSVVSDNPGFYVIPPPDFGEGSQCLVTLTVADMNQQTCEPVQVRIHAEAPRRPRAYATRARLRRKEKMVAVDLVGSSTNIGPTRSMAFVITQLPDPDKEGTVYFVQELDSSDKNRQLIIPANQTSVVAYNGTSRRLRLYFKRNKAGVSFSTAVIKYYVDDGVLQSGEAQVTILANAGKRIDAKCDDTIMGQVFQDRSRSVPLNYRYQSDDPNGVTSGHFDRLQLLVVPKDKSFGDLVQVMNTASGQITRKLKVGDYFIDNSTQLLFVPNVNRTRVNSTVEIKYKYRAITENGKTCSAWINITITPHDSPMQGIEGPYVRLERARTNELTMISLRGIGNRSVGILDSALFTRVTKFGKLFTVNDRAPVNTVSLYTGIGPTLRPFCRQYNCTNFVGSEIKPGDEVKAVNDTRGGKQILVLYLAPRTISAELKSENSRDTALFTFRGLEGVTNEQKLDILVAKGQRPRLYFYFDAPVRSENFSTSPDVRVPIPISDSDHAVEVMPLSIKENRRGIAAPFRLFQLGGMEGKEVKLGDKLTTVQLYGRSAQWLTNNNTVVLTGATRAFRRVYRFRVTVYKKFDDSTIDESSAIEYRVIVQQRAKVPTWDLNSTTTEVKVQVGEYGDVVLAVNDDSDNLISYRLIEAPKYGRLRVTKNQMGTLTSSYLDAGMVFRVSRATLFRQQGKLEYSPSTGSTYTYPLTDKFVVAADNGMGTLSDPLQIVVRVQKNQAIIDNQENNKALPNATYALAGVFVFMATIVAATVMIVRRRRWESYKSIPTTERGNAPHPGINS